MWVVCECVSMVSVCVLFLVVAVWCVLLVSVFVFCECVSVECVCRLLVCVAC